MTPSLARWSEEKAVVAALLLLWLIVLIQLAASFSARERRILAGVFLAAFVLTLIATGA